MPLRLRAHDVAARTDYKNSALLPRIVRFLGGKMSSAAPEASPPPYFAGRSDRRSPTSSPHSLLPQEAEYIIDLSSNHFREREFYDFLETPPEELVCQVCLNVFNEPHVTDCCGQHFCRECLDFCVNDFTKIKSCPHCRETKFKHLIYKPFQRKINELVAYCTNREKGCMEAFKLKEMSKHLSQDGTSGCQYVLLPCPNGCNEKVSRKDIKKHSKETCKQRKVTCEYCGISTAYYLLKQHIEECEKCPVTCSRNCTKDYMLRRDLQNHEDVCPKKLINCPFYEVGCTEQVPREDIQAHVESNACDHMNKMVKAYCQMKKELDLLKMGQTSS